MIVLNTESEPLVQPVGAVPFEPPAPIVIAYVDAVTVMPAKNIDHAIELANDTRFGLSAACFTENLDNALRFALEVNSGNLNINSGTQFRADFMPYGGLKDSGMGKEGPKYAIEEMTELKMVVIHR